MPTAGRLAVVTAVAAAAALLSGPPARADDAEIYLQPGSGVLGAPRAKTDFPFVTGQALAVLTDTRILQANVPGAETNDLNPGLQIGLAVYLTPRLSVQGLATVDTPLDAGGDRAFAGLDGSLSNLFVNYESESFTIYAGKFDAWFGEGWRAIDGVYSGFTSDYYFSRVLGAGGSLIARTSGGAQELGVAVFKRDNSGLNDSWIRSHQCSATTFDCTGAFEPGAGGAGNTDWPESVAVTFDWSEIPSAPGIGFGVDFAHLAAGRDDAKSMTGIAARLAYETALADGVGLKLFAEAAWLDGFRRRDATVADLVASATLSIDPVQITVTAARRDWTVGEAPADGPETLRRDGDWGVALSATYPTVLGVILQAGVIRLEDQGASATIGRARAIYQLRF